MCPQRVLEWPRLRPSADYASRILQKGPGDTGPFLLAWRTGTHRNFSAVSRA